MVWNNNKSFRRVASPCIVFYMKPRDEREAVCVQRLNTATIVASNIGTIFFFFLKDEISYEFTKACISYIVRNIVEVDKY